MVLFLRTRSVLNSKSFLLIPRISPDSLGPVLAPDAPDPTTALDSLFPPPTPSRKAKSRATSARHHAKIAGARKEKSVNGKWERGELITTLSGERAAAVPAATLAPFHPSFSTPCPAPHLPLNTENMAAAFAKIQVMLLVATAVDGLPLSLVAAPVVLPALPRTRDDAMAASDLVATLTPAVTMSHLAPLALYHASLAETYPSFQALLTLLAPSGTLTVYH